MKVVQNLQNGGCFPLKLGMYLFVLLLSLVCIAICFYIPDGVACYNKGPNWCS